MTKQTTGVSIATAWPTVQPRAAFEKSLICMFFFGPESNQKHARVCTSVHV